MKNFLRLAAIIGTLPNTLTNGTTADATQVMADFNYIVNQVNANAAPLANTALLNATNNFTAVQNGVNATGPSNFPTAGQVQGNMNYGSDVGVANAFAINPTPAISAYASVMPFSFIANHMNGSTTTLSVSGLAAMNIVNPNLTQLSSAQIPVGSPVTVLTDSVNSRFLLTSQTGIFGALGLNSNFITTQGGLLITTNKQPTRTVLTSGTAATYTTPAGATRINVLVVGGGAGGGAALTGAGTAGNASSFGSLTANGGASGVAGGGGGASGGSASGGDININGGQGQSGDNAGAISVAGGIGGTVYVGGAGSGGGANQAGSTASANSGCGGGGGGGNTGASGGGGGAGGYCEKLIVLPTATYTYTVGAAATGGSLTGQAGGNGGSGIIIVDEYYT